MASGILTSVLLLFVVFTFNAHLVTGGGDFKVTARPNIVTVEYDETKEKSARLSYDILPWPPPCCKPNNTEWDAYLKVKLELFNDTSKNLLCEIRYEEGEWVNETLTKGCSISSGGRVDDFIPGTSDFVLFKVNSITLWDTGTFSLNLMDNFNKVYSTTTQLVVNARPAPTIRVSPTGDLEEGTEVTFTCLTRDTWPPPDFRWSRGSLGPNLTQETSVATTWYGESKGWFKMRVRKEDHGVAFICSVTNDAGKQTSSYTPSVKFKPVVLIKQCEGGRPHPVQEGKNTRLHCIIRAYPPLDSPLRWTDPSGHVIKGENETSLELIDLSRGAAGNYTCSARNPKGSQSDACLLDVQYGPNVTINGIVKTAKESDNVQIPCTTDSNPRPIEYQWEKSGHPTFELYNETLSFPEVTPEDAGTYTCVATNLVVNRGKWSGSGTIQLLVEFTPRLAEYSFSKYAASPGQSAILECWAQAFPVAKVTWRFQGSPLVDGPRHKIEHDPSVSRVRLSSTEDSDFGVYECTATNSEGTQTFDIHLQRPGKPDPPQKCDLEEVTDREVHLTCISGYGGGEAPGFSVSRSSEGQRKDAADVAVTWPEAYASSGVQVANLKVTGFGPNTNYTLEIHGSNKYGWSDQMLVMRVRTDDGPPLPTVAPPNVGAIVGGVIGGLLVVVIIVGATLYIRKNGRPEVPAVVRRIQANRRRRQAENDRASMIRLHQEELARRYAEQRPSSYHSQQYAHGQGEGHLPGGQGQDHGGQGHYYEGQGYEDQGHAYYYHGEDPQGHVGYDGYPAGGEGAHGSFTNYAYTHEESPEEAADGIGADIYRQQMRVVADVYDPSILREKHQRPGAHAPDVRERQSNLAGMGALAGSHVMLHQQMENRNGNQRLSREPLVEGVSVMENSWAYPREQLSFRQQLGQGRFGELWRAHAYDLGGHPGRLNVAVRVVPENCPPEERKSFELFQLLRPHPHVVALLGACAEKEPIFVILEYCAKGNLQDYLRRNRQPHPEARGVTLTMVHLLRFVLQVAKGMEYISSNGLLHRHLATRNILLDDQFTCKVSDDVALARDMINMRIHEGSIPRPLPLRWLAPECLYDCVYSASSDVWAFGVLIWEVMTLGSTPYPGMTGEGVLELVNSGYRMERPIHCDHNIYILMRDCWHVHPDRRPRWSALCARLDDILDDLESNPEDIVLVSNMRGNLFEILHNLPDEIC